MTFLSIFLSKFTFFWYFLVVLFLGFWSLRTYLLRNRSDRDEGHFPWYRTVKEQTRARDLQLLVITRGLNKLLRNWDLLLKGLCFGVPHGFGVFHICHTYVPPPNFCKIKPLICNMTPTDCMMTPHKCERTSVLVQCVMNVIFSVQMNIGIYWWPLTTTNTLTNKQFRL